MVYRSRTLSLYYHEATSALQIREFADPRDTFGRVPIRIGKSLATHIDMLRLDASVHSAVPLTPRTAVTMAKIPRCGIRRSPSIACFGSGAGSPASIPRIVARLSAIDQIKRGIAVNA
jgi:hypothetical protein